MVAANKMSFPLGFGLCFKCLVARSLLRLNWVHKTDFTTNWFAWFRIPQTSMGLILVAR